MLSRLFAFMVLFAAGMGALIASQHADAAQSLFVAVGIGLVFLALLALGWPRGGS